MRCAVCAVRFAVFGSLAMSAALAATAPSPVAARASAAPSRARRTRQGARAAPPPPSRSSLFAPSFRGTSGRAGALGPTDDARAKLAEDGEGASFGATPGTPVEYLDAHDTDAHDDDDEDHDHDDVASITTEHGSPLWRDFALAATGSWGGCCVEFDGDGMPLDIPVRFVHGVGRVPARNMPFREPEMDWMTKCETTATDDGLRVAAARAIPEIGNEDASSSCGGAEWGEHVAFIADDPARILRGANEDKTILPDGSFSSGERVLPGETGAVVRAHHCLADPSDPRRRVRVVHRVRRADGRGGAHATWATSSVDVWMERRGFGGPECVSPFSRDARLSVDDLVSKEALLRWRYDPASSAVYFLEWDDSCLETDAADPDAKSFFTMLADAGQADGVAYLEDVEPEGVAAGASARSDADAGAIGSAGAPVDLAGLVRLPGNVWVYCGPAGAHDLGVGAGGEEGQLVLECGWAPPGGNARTISTRAYDLRTGRLDSVSLARETL